MKRLFYLFTPVYLISTSYAQQQDTLKRPATDKSALKYSLNADGSHYFQAIFMNQTWLRFNESNEGTTLFSKPASHTFDIGLRRTRIQLFGQITDRTFIYFQFGQNNFNNTSGYSTGVPGNRKIAAFFHDALCEFRLTKGNQLKLGGGLTVLNGLSRFSQPSVSTIMTLDVPVFLQYSVDQTDQFDRRLSVFARGQLGKLDYRLYLSNPFPVNSNGSVAPPIGRNAAFVNLASVPNGYGPGVNYQYGGYFAYNFFESEGHTTPYMQGTYLGTKKVWNIAFGGVYQEAATWNLADNHHTGVYNDTSYNDMIHFSFETFLDVPVNKEKGTMANAFAGYYTTNYGTAYLRYNGLMNPGTSSTATNLVQANAYGNAFPMFGTGHIVYLQAGFLLPKKLLGERHGQLMPYLSGQFADYTALQHRGMLVFEAGLNWLIKEHHSKFSLGFQNRPTYVLDANTNVKESARKSSITLQYQISI